MFKIFFDDFDGNNHSFAEVQNISRKTIEENSGISKFITSYLLVFY